MKAIAGTAVFVLLVLTPTMGAAARAHRHEHASRDAPRHDMPNMESYQLVLLKRGPAWTPEVTPETTALQAQHIGHLQRMGREGKMVLAGPFGDQADPTLRGACIYRVGSADEARRLASEDPAVKAGRLVPEVVSWWVEKGYVAFPRAPTGQTRLPTH